MNGKRERLHALTVGCLISFCAVAYEDMTHQKLTGEAIRVAQQNGAFGELLDYRDSIIVGAGSIRGEDYTKYEIRRRCPLPALRAGNRSAADAAGGEGRIV